MGHRLTRGDIKVVNVIVAAHRRFREVGCWFNLVRVWVIAFTRGDIKVVKVVVAAHRNHQRRAVVQKARRLKKKRREKKKKQALCMW